MPFGFKLFTVLLFFSIFVPKIALLFQINFGWVGLPVYFIFYYMFGTHFIFPSSLRKYHGAEHKVFSDRGVKSRARLYLIGKAAITNRYCSTNSVVIYFSFVILGTLSLLYWFPFSQAIEFASYLSVLLVPITNYLIKFRVLAIIRNYVIAVSYFLQKTITTTEPERKHLLTAIQSYRCLAEVEFPEHLSVKKSVKEEKRMAIVDVTIIPIGNKGSSVSDYVAEIHLVLEKYQDKINYRLTPMSTIIEGELPILFEILQAIHEVPFQAGVKRVATNIRIDDRRDKMLKMENKITSVEEKIKSKKEEQYE